MMCLKRWSAQDGARARRKIIIPIVCIMGYLRQCVSKCYFLCCENKFRLRIGKGFACTSSGLLSVIFVQQKITFGAFAENSAKTYL